MDTPIFFDIRTNYRIYSSLLLSFAKIHPFLN